MCLNTGTPINYHFPFGINGEVVVLVVQILKHFTVILKYEDALGLHCLLRPTCKLRIFGKFSKWPP